MSKNLLSAFFISISLFSISFLGFLSLFPKPIEAQQSCVATTTDEVIKLRNWDLTVSFNGAPVNFQVEYIGSNIFAGPVLANSNPYRGTFRAPNADFTGVRVVNVDKTQTLCTLSKSGDPIANATAKLESPAGDLGQIKTLPSIIVSGLVPGWEYRIGLSGEWDGSKVSEDGRDEFKADANGRITVNSLCDNGEANRTDCEDTFKTGVYNIIVRQLDGKTVGSFRFSVDSGKLPLTEACKPYDFNGDGIVDTLDGQKIAGFFGTTKGNSSYDSKYDVNNDGKIDQLDVDHALKCGEGSTSVTKSFINTALGNISTDPKQLVNTLLTIAIGVAGGIAFLLIVYGGFRMAFSQGDPKAVQEARDILTSAIVGLLLIVFSVFLLNLIGVDILGLPIGD